MITESTSISRLTQLKAGLNKWRIAFLVIALSYAVLLVINLSNQPLNWDEVVHLNSALLLKHGLYTQFVSTEYYPPLFDSLTMVFYNAFGVSLVTGRLVSAVFSVLTLWVVFELAYSMYGGKAAILSTVLLAVMPGYFWLSRMAMLEVMLVFFSTLSLFFFYHWLRLRKNSLLVLSGLALGLAFLTKYQALATGIIMIITLIFAGKGQLKRLFSKFTVLIVTAVAVAIPWMVAVYQVFTSKFLSQWIYTLDIGNPAKLLYSDRYPLPIFYFVELVWPYNDIHPVSVLVFALALLGLGLLVWRRKDSDKFVFIWFASIFIFFTFIENKQWRFLLPLFPAIAISAAAFVLFAYSKAENAWKSNITLNKRRLSKLAAAVLIAFFVVAMAFSAYDNYTIVKTYNIQIDISQATNYVAARDAANQSIIVLCPFNFFSADMVKFYLWADGKTQVQTYQYPQLPVDSYTPTFNITEFIGLCKQNNVKFVFTYEYGGTVPYFNTTLNLAEIYTQIYASGNFSQITPEQTFGQNPRRILILNFTG